MTEAAKVQTRLPAQDKFMGADAREIIKSGMHNPASRDKMYGTDQRETLTEHTHSLQRDIFAGIDKREKMDTHMQTPKYDKYFAKDAREKPTTTMPLPKKDDAHLFPRGKDASDDATSSKEESNILQEEKKPVILRNFPYHMAQEILSHVHIKADIRDRQLLVYTDSTGYYSSMKELEFWVWLNRYLVDSLYAPRMSTPIVRELFNQLLTTPSIQTTMDDMDPNQDFVNTLNGVVNIRTRKFYEHSPHYLFINCLAGNYLGKNAPMPEKYVEWITKLLPEPDLPELMCCIIGYMISNYHTAKKFFYLFGASNSGKSQILHLIEKLVGEHVASHIAIEDMSEKHTAGELYGKKINTCAELEPGKAIKKTRILKAHTGGDMIDANPKRRAHFKYLGKTKIAQAANPKPTIALEADEDAFWDRLVPIEFKEAIPEKERVPHFIDSLLAKEADAILTFQIRYMRQYVEDGIFRLPLPQSARLLLEQLRRNNNSVRLFVETQCVFEPTATVLKCEIKERYLRFCNENGLTALSEIKFIKVLRNMYPQIQEKRSHAHAAENSLWTLVGIRLLDNS